MSDQPPPCGDHDANELSCAACGTVRTVFYAGVAVGVDAGDPVPVVAPQLHPQIYDGSIGDLINLPTAAEKLAARVAVLLQGHAAGLHVLPAMDCPSCSPVETPNRDRLRRRAALALDRVFEVMGERQDDGDGGEHAVGVAEERFVQSMGDYVLSRLHHNSHYGVAAERCPTCDSPAPNLHPAMQSEGEVQPCIDRWHLTHNMATHKRNYGADDARG
jgi:hypothetical protein